MALVTPLRRAAFVLALGTLVVLYVVRIGSWAYANRLVAKDSSNYPRALKYEPNDPKLQSIAGLAQFSAGDWQGSLIHLSRAAERQPFNARHWLDLAMVYQVMDRTAEQEQALHRALAVDPRTPQVAWEVANFELARDNREVAMAQLRTVIESDPFLAPSAISAAWRFSGDYDAVAALLPSKVAPWQEFLRVLISSDDIANAQRAWSTLTRLPEPVSSQSALVFTNYLLQRESYSAADNAWRQFAAAPKFRNYARTENLVVNSGFDEDVLNGGFDWRYSNSDGIDVSLDTGNPHDGTRALLISFAEGTTGDPHIYQLVPVQPNTEYQLNAFMRSEEIYTLSAPRFAVSDAKSGNSYFSSDPMVGTTAWTQLNGRFRTSADTHLLKIGLTRDAEASLIRGRVWLDEVSMVTK